MPHLRRTGRIVHLLFLVFLHLLRCTEGLLLRVPAGSISGRRCLNLLGTRATVSASDASISITLYGNKACPYVYKALMALEEKKVKHNVDIEMDFVEMKLDGPLRPEWFRQVAELPSPSPCITPEQNLRSA